jgi:hypothetical protein
MSFFSRKAHLPEADPHGVMADAKDLLQFLERGVRLVADVRLKLVRIELAPVAPTGLGGQGVRFDGGQIAIDGALAQPKNTGGLGPRAAPSHKLHHPLAQIQRVGFHPHSLPPYTANVNVKCYSDLHFGNTGSCRLGDFNHWSLPILAMRPVAQPHNLDISACFDGHFPRTRNYKRTGWRTFSI